MARRVRDAKRDTRAARAKLSQRREPYWRSLSAGLAIGYRRGKTGGSWIARRYDQGERHYRSIGPADDILDANRATVFSFDQAQAKAREWTGGQIESGPYTVANAMDAYLEYLTTEGRTAAAIADAKYRDRAFVRPQLGRLEVASLTAERLRQWRDNLAKAAPRLRTRAGEKQKHRKVDDDDARRARRATANRTWTTLRAALNRAFETDKVDSDKAWRKVKPFRSVEVARAHYLSIAEAKRLVNAADSEFRPLLLAALLTGGRFGQLAQLAVSDFNADAGTVRMRTRKGDGTERVHHTHLTEEGVQFFKQSCAGRPAEDLIFKKHDGSMWGKSHQRRPMLEACQRAKIKPTGFHQIRHTHASHAVMRGMPLLVLARNLGHADGRMAERHYSHLSDSYVSEVIRTRGPQFGLKPQSKVTPLR